MNRAFEYLGHKMPYLPADDCAGRLLVLEGTDGVGRSTQAVVIVQIAAMDAGAGRPDHLGRGIRASQADGVMTVGNQIAKHRSAHKTRRTRDENLHGILPMSATVITVNAMTVTDIP